METFLKERTQVSIGIVLPVIWTVIFVFLVLVSFVSTKIPVAVSAESLILLTFIFSPLIFIIGFVVSLIRLAYSGINRNVLFAIVLNVILFVVWFIIRKSFYIEVEFIN